MVMFQQSGRAAAPGGAPRAASGAARGARSQFRIAVGGRWFVDETYVKVAGRWRYPYRAVDQHGQVIDVRLSARRDIAAARQFFTGPLAFTANPTRWSPTWRPPSSMSSTS